MAAALVQQYQATKDSIGKQLLPYCFPITLPPLLAAAIATHDVRQLRLYANDLLITEVDLKQYPNAVQGHLFIPFKRVNPDLAIHQLRLSIVRLVLRAEPPCGPPVLLPTSLDQGVPQEFLVEEWNGNVNALVVANDSVRLAVPRTV